MAESAQSSRPPPAREGEFVFLSELIGRPAFGPDGERIGKVVGFRGLVRRMGWQPFVDGLVRAVRPRARYLTRENFVPWKHVQPLAAGSARVRLDLARRALAEVHPSDLAEILEDLDRRERAVL